MRYEKVSRVFHIALLLTVLAQLLTEQFMQVPKPGEPIDLVAGFIFSVHQMIGFIVLIIAITYLLVIMDKLEHRTRLFPWLDRDLRAALLIEIKRDLPGWFTGKLPNPEQAHLIAGTVHGLGLLLATGLGMTGSIIFLGIKHDGSMPPAIHTLREIHELLGTMLWIFIIGHVSMAVIHQIKGHRVLQAIFSSDK